MTALQPITKMSGRDWGAVATGFIGSFLIGLAATGESSGLQLAIIGIGVLLLLVALGLAVASIRDRRAEILERTDWLAFEHALGHGLRFEVPGEMGYAAYLPAVLDDLADVGEPADGEARNAIVGEEGDIHWCAFQHERADGTATVGLVGLHPDRYADTYPHLDLRVADPGALTFDDRFSVSTTDQRFADVVLHEVARGALMAVAPFEWRLEGNQIITSADRSSTPQEAIEFIQTRLKPLAAVSAAIPLDA